MGFDIKRFRKKDVRNEFICPICRDILEDPILVENCEHVFCRKCIDEWLQQSDNKLCPIDRLEILKNSLRPAQRSFRTLIISLLISCDFATNGCEKWIKIEELVTHVAKCAFNPQIMNQEIEYPSGCGAQLKLRQDKYMESLIEHQSKSKIDCQSGSAIGSPPLLKESTNRSIIESTKSSSSESSHKQSSASSSHFSPKETLTTTALSFNKCSKSDKSVNKKDSNSKYKLKAKEIKSTEPTLPTFTYSTALSSKKQSNATTSISVDLSNKARGPQKVHKQQKGELQLSKNQIAKEEIKVLLLGETGVGKSTFFNAFANYLKFPQLIYAKKYEPCCLIQSSFIITDASNNNVAVTFGLDENESKDIFKGSSGTNVCRNHVFEIGKGSIRFIDTPGIGATNGIEQDKDNIENILVTIGAHDYLNCICILLKANNSRLNALFSYVVIQLLSQLDKSAASNIIFVYTHSRGSNFRPGDTIVPIKALLSEIEEKINVKIPHDKNVFCLDNETFRYMLAVQQNIEFNRRDIKGFEDSWTESVKQMKQFVNYILHGVDGRGLKPHSTRNTISISEARRMVEMLREPTQQIANEIEMNISLLEEEEKRMKDYQGNIKNLAQKYTIPIIETRTSETPEPHCVCTSIKCREHVTLSSGVTYTHYPQVCDRFKRNNAFYNIGRKVLSYSPLWYTFSMFNWDFSCKICKCSQSNHNIMNYKIEVIERADDSLKKELDYTKSSEKVQKIIVNTLKKRIEEIRHEQSEIIKATAKFACFLNNNAIISYNDTFEKYIELSIENEKSKKSDKYTEGQIIRYKDILKNYREMKNILDKAAIENKNQKIKVSNVFELIELLYKLPIYGKELKLRCSIQDRADRRSSQLTQLTHKITGVENQPSALYSYLNKSFL